MPLALRTLWVGALLAGCAAAPPTGPRGPEYCADRSIRVLPESALAAGGDLTACDGESDDCSLAIVFFARWCAAPCDAVLRELETYRRSHPEGALRIVGSSNEQDAIQLRRRLATLDVSIPTVLDSSGVIRDEYRALVLPTVVFVDRRGDVRARWTGYRSTDASELARELDELSTMQAL